MDKLARRLREDAAAIDAEISAQLDSRIHASLAAIEPEAARPRRRTRQPLSFWLVSSLTGVAAAVLVIVILNVVDSDAPVTGPPAVAGISRQPIEIPGLHLDVEAAMLTDPLAQELEDLQADLKKAQEVVRGDVRIDL